MIWHRQIGDGPIKVIVIHGWFWDHRICTPMFDYLDTQRFCYALPDIRASVTGLDKSIPFASSIRRAHASVRDRRWGRRLMGCLKDRPANLRKRGLK